MTWGYVMLCWKNSFLRRATAQLQKSYLHAWDLGAL